MNIKIESFKQYQELSAKTALKTTKMQPVYFILKLVGEIGELSEALARYKEELFELRPDKNERRERRQKAIDEAGDVLWYVAQIPASLGITAPIDFDSELYEPSHAEPAFLPAARISEELGKAIRHGWSPGDPAPFELSQVVIKNLPKILDAVRYVCIPLESTITEAMERNIEKVFSRHARGVTSGRGDDR